MSRHGHRGMPHYHEGGNYRAPGMAHGGHWMREAFGAHPGKLHRRLHVPEGEKIPAKKLAKAAHSDSPSLRKEVALARVGARYGKH